MIVASSKDLTAAMALLVLAIVPIATGLPGSILDILETNPFFSKLVWVIVLLFLLYKKYILTAVVLVAIGLMIRFEVFGSYAYSHDGILAQYAAEARSDPRFDVSSDVDLQIANGTIEKDPSRWLDPGRKRGPLLLFPPTPEQLSLVGNNGH
jgi:hypothetical protein